MRLGWKGVVCGAVPIGNTPAEFDKVIRAETAKWAPIIKAAGTKAQ